MRLEAVIGATKSRTSSLAQVLENLNKEHIWGKNLNNLRYLNDAL